MGLGCGITKGGAGGNTHLVTTCPASSLYSITCTRTLTNTVTTRMRQNANIKLRIWLFTGTGSVSNKGSSRSAVRISTLGLGLRLGIVSIIHYFESKSIHPAVHCNVVNEGDQQHDCYDDQYSNHTVLNESSHTSMYMIVINSTKVTNMGYTLLKLL